MTICCIDKWQHSFDGHFKNSIQILADLIYTVHLLCKLGSTFWVMLFPEENIFEMWKTIRHIYIEKHEVGKENALLILNND